MRFWTTGWKKRLEMCSFSAMYVSHSHCTRSPQWVCLAIVRDILFVRHRSLFLLISGDLIFLYLAVACFAVLARRRSVSSVMLFVWRSLSIFGPSKFDSHARHWIQRLVVCCYFAFLLFFFSITNRFPCTEHECNVRCIKSDHLEPFAARLRIPQIAGLDFGGIDVCECVCVQINGNARLYLAKLWREKKRRLERLKRKQSNAACCANAFFHLLFWNSFVVQVYWRDEATGVHQNIGRCIGSKINTHFLPNRKRV